MFGKFLNKKAKIVEETDPDKVFVENIRRYFNISTREAKKICDIAVEEGVMRRKFAITCKNKDCERIIDVYKSLDNIPHEVSCLHCELNEKHKFTFDTNDLEIVEYFQYIDR
jgi:hypothetical protein